MSRGGIAGWQVLDLDKISTGLFTGVIRCLITLLPATAETAVSQEGSSVPAKLSPRTSTLTQKDPTHVSVSWGLWLCVPLSGQGSPVPLWQGVVDLLGSLRHPRAHGHLSRNRVNLDSPADPLFPEH